MQFMYIDHRLCVPDRLAAQLVHEWHTKLGHTGENKTEQDLRDRFIISGLRSLVHQVVQGCQLCQAVKKPNWNTDGVWHSIPIPPRPGACISMDIVDISSSKTWDGKDVDCAVVVVDRHSGWIDAYPAKKKGLTSKAVAHMLHEHWLPIMGVPQEIMSDLGAHFAGQWFKTFCALKGIMHAQAISYRSATNGRAERAIASVLDALRKIQNDKGTSWPEALPQALSMVRTAAGPTGQSPSQVVFGRDVLQQGLPLPLTQEAEDAKAFHERMQQVDDAVQRQLTKIHADQEEDQNPSRTIAYKEGQHVWVLRPKRMDKLSSWWTGPHVLIKQVGQDTWEVDVGNKHRVVHHAQMKPWYAPVVGLATPLHHHMLTEDSDEKAAPDEWIVEKILSHRKKQDGSVEFLTRWQGYKPEDDTWEPAKHFLQKVNIDWLKYCKQHKIDFTVMQHMQHMLSQPKVK